MAHTADLTSFIPAPHNAALYPPERREACHTIAFMEHPVHDDEFAVEYPADEHGKISPQARPTAWRYGFQAAGHTITVRQTADALTITVDGRPLDTTSLDQSPTKHRGHKIASFLDDELRRITPH
ncbi:MAG TPA: hypothetical protein VKZ89_10435 [Thermobifida alba]|nr:hypothetical protein [Thermobifida alba]